MVHILVTGCNGQLGNEIKLSAGEFPHFRFTFTDIDELDITNELHVDAFFKEYEPDVVINCAGYTAVDKAEEEPQKAMWLNRDAVSNLASACDRYDCFMVHISTDYVFDGKNTVPYHESDIPSPVSAYGLSKLSGEAMMMSCLQRGLIIRTSWLYSSFGHNFVKTILKKCRENIEVKVVSDQIGSPTYGRDLAVTILKILPAVIPSQQFELFHYSNEGQCSWYEFAREVAVLAGLPCRILPVATAGYPVKATRPAYSVLDTTLIRERFGITVPGWKESLAECLKVMGEGRREEKS
jgi:dTDP-4-dehydrorhamnose reductase